MTSRNLTLRDLISQLKHHNLSVRKCSSCISRFFLCFLPHTSGMQWSRRAFRSAQRTSGIAGRCNSQCVGCCTFGRGCCCSQGYSCFACSYRRSNARGASFLFLFSLRVVGVCVRFDLVLPPLLCSSSVAHARVTAQNAVTALTPMLAAHVGAAMTHTERSVRADAAEAAAGLARVCANVVTVGAHTIFPAFASIFQQRQHLYVPLI